MFMYVYAIFVYWPKMNKWFVFHALPHCVKYCYLDQFHCHTVKGNTKLLKFSIFSQEFKIPILSTSDIDDVAVPI